MTLTDTKIALENELIRRLIRILAPWCQERAAREIGVMARLHWTKQIEDALAKHYTRVVLIMTGRTPTKDDTLRTAALSIAHYQSLTNRTHRQSVYMMDGLEKIAADVEIEAKALETKATKWTDKAKEIWAKVKGKLRGVATQETNGPAEEARLQDAKRVAGNRTMVKFWSTVGDDRVRPTHVEADGQRQYQFDPFIVGGAQLMFPGDMQMGAPLREVINCRCSATYAAVNPDGSYDYLDQTTRGVARSVHRNPETVQDPALITRAVRIAENRRERVFLQDGLEAFVSVRGGVLRVTRPGAPWTVLARGRFTHGMFRGARVQNLEIAPGAERLGIPHLIEQSIRETNAR